MLRYINVEFRNLLRYKNVESRSLLRCPSLPCIFGRHGMIGEGNGTTDRSTENVGKEGGEPPFQSHSTGEIPMVMSLPMTSQDLTSAPWGSATNDRVFALTSLAMCSSQVLNSPMR